MLEFPDKHFQSILSKIGIAFIFSDNKNQFIFLIQL